MSLKKFNLLLSPTGAFLPHLSWLLRTLVVDLKVSASKKQRSYVQKIVDLFTKPGDVTSDGQLHLHLLFV